MGFLLQMLGVVLVGAALVDVYLTVLVAWSGTGLISPRLHRGVWLCLRGFSQTLPGARTWLRLHRGSILLVLTMLLWTTLMVCGFAVVVWPELGDAIQSSNGRPTSRTFGTALYFAGYSLTTLGTGDLIATTDLFRLLMVLQAGLGFSFLTLTPRASCPSTARWHVAIDSY